MNPLQKIFFILCIITLICSIYYVPYKVQYGSYDDKSNQFYNIEKEWVEFHSILLPPKNFVREYDYSFDKIIIKKNNLFIQLSIVAAELVLFGGLIVLTKSKKKKEE